VPHMEQVEAAVGKCDRPARGSIDRGLAQQRIARKDAAHVQLESSVVMACRNSAALTVAVPRFMTTRPPA